MQYKIELNEIEWITNGERGSAMNLNRALKQYLGKNNTILNAVQNEIDDIKNTEIEIPEYNLTAVIVPGSTDVEEIHLGSYLVRNTSIGVQQDLPVGWNCYIVAENNDIVINLGTEEALETRLTEFSIKTGRTAKLVKITETKWAVSIERLQLTVEDIEQP